MSTDTVRATVYLEPGLHQALRLKAATARRSMSDLVNDALREAMREDDEDLRTFTDRASEPAITYEAFLAALRADGTL